MTSTAASAAPTASSGMSESPKVLAVASTGGHWEQLMRLAPAFAGARVTFACTDAGQAERYGLQHFVALPDCNQDQPMRLLRCLLAAFTIVRKFRPEVIISTGAAPGLLCLLWGRVLGARTIWIDSIANSEELSLSGRLARKFCHRVYTQWEHLARDGGPAYGGSVL